MGRAPRRVFQKCDNWPKLRAEYVSGNISIQKLADKYNVSYLAVREQAKTHAWMDARKKYRADLERKTDEKMASKAATAEVNRLMSLQKSADSMGKVIQKIFDDTEQFNRHIVTNGVGIGETVTEERIYKKVDTRAIKDLTSAMKDLAATLRNLYDLPTIQEKASMDIAAQRLQMDAKKAEVSEPAEGGGVVEIAPVLEDTEDA